jgi:nucleoside-diphosphate-sugar epimerase
MKILVAGGAGYVGTALVPELIKRDHAVTVIDLLWFGNHLPESVCVQRRDLMSMGVDELRPFDVVVFLAGLSNDPMADFSPARNFIENSAAPSFLCYSARKAGVSRFVYGSSCSVYGYAATEPQDESGPTITEYPYGISKLQGEYACRALANDDFSVIALRKGTVCGVSPRMRFDLLINTMFKTALVEGVVHVNNPDIWRPVLAIEDAVQGYVRAIEAPLATSGTYNLASVNLTVGQAAEQVMFGMRKHLNRNIRLDLHHREDLRNYRVDWSKIEQELGYEARYSVATIIAGLCEHYGSHVNLENDLYYNIRMFRRIESRTAEVSEA